MENQGHMMKSMAMKKTSRTRKLQFEKVNQFDFNS
jgi:hypothetical protein